MWSLQRSLRAVISRSFLAELTKRSAKGSLHCDVTVKRFMGHGGSDIWNTSILWDLGNALVGQLH